MGRHITFEMSEDQGNRMAEAIEAFMDKGIKMDVQIPAVLLPEIIELSASATAWREEAEK